MSQRLSQASQKSQGSQGTPRPQNVTNMSSRDQEEATRDVVRYILMSDFDKHPIKHADLLKNIALLRTQTRSSGFIIDKATKILREVYGLDLIQLNKSAKQYILVNSLDHQEHIVFPDVVESNLVLLAIILTLIFMTSGSHTLGMEAIKVHEFLSTLGIHHDGHHEYFGNVKNVIELLKSQQYLEVERMEQTDPPKLEYRWGERSHYEFSPRKALEFASEMCNVGNIEKWAAHYKAVKEFEGTQ